MINSITGLVDKVIKTNKIMPSLNSDNNNNAFDMTMTNKQQNEQILIDKEKRIEQLEEQVTSLSKQLQNVLLHNNQQQHVNEVNNNNNLPNIISTLSMVDDNDNDKYKKMKAEASSKTYQQQQQRRHHTMSLDVNNVSEEIQKDGTKRIVHLDKASLGNMTTSIGTKNKLNQLAYELGMENSKNEMSYYHNIKSIISRIFKMFESPSDYIGYIKSNIYAKDIITLCSVVGSRLELNEPRVVYLQSPIYVFGDIHGNLEDLHFFSDNIWRLGIKLTAGTFVFLGDYVDRGMNCLEVIAYLFALKHSIPNKIYLLRGNHETRSVNSWIDHYQTKSFLYQCQIRFNNNIDIGTKVWESINTVFDRLPLAAVIDQDIFCVHGGIPRPISNNTSSSNSHTTTRIQDILNVPNVAGINPPYEYEDIILHQQVASDCIWSDPASEYQEQTSINQYTGFGESLRGGGCIAFGNKAVSDFLLENQFSYIMRAHEAHAHGVALSKDARVFTVFSTSQDHHLGSNAMAGCILVDNDKLQVINRSPAYKNHYVHRRNSVSVNALSNQEIQDRIKVGLIREGSIRQEDMPEQIYNSYSEDSDDDYDDDNGAYWEKWEDLKSTSTNMKKSGNNDDDYDDSDDDDIGLSLEDINSQKFDSNRRPSIDLGSITKHDSDTLLAIKHDSSDSVTVPDRSKNNGQHKRMRRSSSKKDRMFESITELSEEIED